MKNTRTPIILLALAATTLTSQAVIQIYQDEAQFNADLSNSSDFGSITDPTTADLSGQTSHSVSQTINGQDYSFTFREGTYDSSNGGTASSIILPTNVSDIATSSSSFVIEHASVGQGGANISAWGYDTDNNISSSSNTTALFDFTSSTTPVYSFSLSAADFEGGNAWSNIVAAFRPDGTLIDATSFDWPAPDYGNGTVQFIGFGADEAIGYLAFVVGEDDATGYGLTERIAIGDFKMGTTPLTTVPEPSSCALLGFGAVTLLLRRKK